jgi:hypothetical protein
VNHFEPFAFDGWLSGWDLDSKYSAGADLLRVDDDNCFASGTCGQNALRKAVVSGASPYVVEASLVYEPYSFGYAGVIFGLAQGTGWWACLLNRTTSSRVLTLWQYPGSGTTVVDKVSATNVESTNAGASVLRWVRAYWDGARITCEFKNSEGDVARTQPFQAQGLTGRAGVRVYDASVDFRSFTVYE